MQNTTKMILVPEDKYHALASQQQQMIPPGIIQMSDLDKEMKDIINNSYIHPEQRLAQYQQTLRRYMVLRDKEFGQSAMPSSSRDNIKSPETVFPMQDIMSSLPKTLTYKASILLEHIRRNAGKFQLSDKNELILNGQKVAGTNFIDLIHEVVRNRNVRDLVGAKEFARALADTNVPLESLGDKGRLNLLQQGPSVSLSASPAQTPSVNRSLFHTPTDDMEESPSQNKRSTRSTIFRRGGRGSGERTIGRRGGWASDSPRQLPGLI